MSRHRPIALLALLVFIAAQPAREKRQGYASAAYMIEIDALRPGGGGAESSKRSEALMYVERWQLR